MNRQIDRFFVLALVLFAANAQALQPAPRLPKAQQVSIEIEGMQQNVVLKSYTDTQPLLQLNQKRTIELRKPSQISGSNVPDLKSLKDLFTQYGFASANSYQDFYVIDYFAHGYEGFTSSDIFHRATVESDNSIFWTAIIPKAAKVDKIILQKDWFSTGYGAHAQLRFQLNSPILLVPMKAAGKKAFSYQDLSHLSLQEQFVRSEIQPVLISGDVAYSLFASRSVGGPQSWNFETSIGGAFANSYTLASTFHSAIYLATNDLVEQFELKNPSTVGTQVFRNALQHAEKFREANVYHLTMNSCITEIMSLLTDPSAGYSSLASLRQTHVFNAYTFAEKSAPAIARQIPSLNDEMGSAPKTKALLPQIQASMPIFQDPHTEKALLELTIQLAPLNFVDLQKVEAVYQSPGTTEEKIQAMKDQIAGLDEAKARAVMETLSANPKLLAFIQVLMPKM